MLWNQVLRATKKRVLQPPLNCFLLPGGISEKEKKTQVEEGQARGPETAGESGGRKTTPPVKVSQVGPPRQGDRFVRSPTS